MSSNFIKQKAMISNSCVYTGMPACLYMDGSVCAWKDVMALYYGTACFCSIYVVLDP